MKNRELSIYIHFLFCKSRCPYCDFFKGILPKNFDEDEYVQNIIENLDDLQKLSGKRDVKSIFFGGGTPSILSDKAVGFILDEIAKRYNVKNGAEISIEANPNTYDREKFVGFNKVGINRLSLGVQSLNKDDLKFLGRTHLREDALKAIETGIDIFDKFSIDLIYGRSDEQSLDIWFKEIDEALGFGVKHISLYQLSIEEGTVFYKKNVKAQNDEKSAFFYEKTVEYLRQNGFERYEVSNFAKDEYNQSVHNLVYWQGGDYIGLGKGAHGRLKVDDKIYALVDGKVDCNLSSYERAEELVIMGLRIKDGIKKKDFFEACGVELFEVINYNKMIELKNMGLMEIDNDGIWLTDEGMLLMNKIIEEILL